MGEVVVVGDAVIDVVVQLERPPEVGSDVAARISTRPGGQGASTAAWLADAGAKVHLVSASGRDGAGDRLEAALAAVRVCAHLERDSERPTGTIVVLVDAGGERTMLTDRGANRGLSGLPPALVTDCTHLHLSGYVLLDPASRAAGLACLAAARSAGCTVSVSASSRAPLAAAGAGSFIGWTRGAELLFANEAEAEQLCGSGDPARAAVQLAGVYGEAVVTGGAAGAWWTGSSDRAHHIPPPAASVVDTTGAGDAFAAGFLARWLERASPEEAGQTGAELAARALGAVGSWPQ